MVLVKLGRKGGGGGGDGGSGEVAHPGAHPLTDCTTSSSKIGSSMAAANNLTLDQTV